MSHHSIDVYIFGLDRERGKATVSEADIAGTRLTIASQVGMLSQKNEKSFLLSELHRLLTTKDYIDSEAIKFAARAIIMLQTHKWTEQDLLSVHSVILEAGDRVSVLEYGAADLDRLETELAAIRAWWREHPGTIAPRPGHPPHEPKRVLH